MNREDFPMLNDEIVYFDNSATSFKPQCVIEAMNEYYTKYSANAHRGDYDISLRVDQEYERVRTKVKELISAQRDEEIVFTKGTTDGLNMVVFGYMAKFLQKGDEVLISKSEHASNVLPWFVLAKKKGIVIKYIPLDADYSLNVSAIEPMITEKTKVISLAHVTNVIGDVRDVDAIGEICMKHDILFVVDAAQSIGHMKIDVQKSHIDFLAFSAHKMLGPTGVGALYGKYSLLNDMDPVIYGGGMNAFFESDYSYELKEVPWKFEAGTPNIAEVIGMGRAIDYLQEMGLDKIHEYEMHLKELAIAQLEKIPNIKVFNKKAESGIITFNIDKVFSQDAVIFLNRFKICVRSGNHCAKILKDEIGVTNTCRASFYFYNTEEEVLKLVEALKCQDKIYDNII